MERFEYHYTYMLTALNPTDSRVLYYGVRSCKCLPREDTGYWSSSKAIREARKQGVVFKKTILRVFRDRLRAAAHEVELHARYDVANNPRYWNERANVSPLACGLQEPFWTFEECYADAQKFQTRTAWQKAPKTGYPAALRNGWLPQCCAHMDRPRVEDLTKEQCVAEALNFPTVAAWRKGTNGSAFNRAYKLGWLPECTAHMTMTQRPKGWWTKERCMAAGREHQTISAFQQSNGAAYNKAHRMGWLPECTAHMSRAIMPAGYWTKETCKADAMKYGTRTAWARAGTSGYCIAAKRGWLDYCCSDMPMAQKAKGHWTLERCMADAKKYTTRQEWRHAPESGYHRAKKNGWLPACCAHMDVVQRPKGYWTLELCKADALNYSTRMAWQDGSAAGYNAALRRQWVDECCGHMVKPAPNRLKWTRELCKADALKYSTRSAWKAGSTAYHAAVKKKWTAECCAHMPRRAA